MVKDCSTATFGQYDYTESSANPLTLITRVPKPWGVEEGLSFFRGTALTALPDIREFGLLGSNDDTGLTHATEEQKRQTYLFTCKNTTTPQEFYSMDIEVPVLTETDGTAHRKTFGCVLNIHSTRDWGQATICVPKNGAGKTQHLFLVDHCQIASVYFICKSAAVHVKTIREREHWRWAPGQTSKLAKKRKHNTMQSART